MNIENLYNEISKCNAKDNEAAQLLSLRDWFFRIADFDMQTGQPLPLALYSLNERINEKKQDINNKIYLDQVARIVNHCYEAVIEITKQLDANILREHAMLPIYGVKEVDSTSINWLSRRPGRNVREKLAGNPYLLAVKRRMSIDNSENRLFKAFCLRMRDILSTKEEAFGRLDEKSEELLYKIQMWIRTSDSEEIGIWNNVPPNNKLLQHKHYRRLWDGWLWLQSLEEDLQKDKENILENYSTVLLWTLISKLRSHESIRIAEQPSFFNYDEFSINTLQSIKGILRKPGVASVKSILWKKSDEECQYGNFLMSDGETIFFHINNFLEKEDFEKIKIGTLLSYELKESNKGKHAKKVELAGDKVLEISREGSVIVVKLDNDILIIKLEINDKGKVSINMEEVKIEVSSIEAIYTAANRILKKFFRLKHVFIEEKEVRAVGSKENSIYIDICSIRPLHFENGEMKTLPFMFMQQFWKAENNGEIALQVGKTNCIELSKEAQVISILNLFSDKRRYQSSQLRSAAMTFSEQLKNYFKTNNIIYLVPDSRDEFTLEHIRKGMNFFFKNAEPLPRSIATVFNWQASEDFENNDVKEGDYVFVLDCIGDEVSITPVELCFRLELKNTLPETNGFYWERHPNIEVNNDAASVSIAIKLLQKMKCNSAKIIGNLIGFKSLVDERESITWAEEEEKYFTASENIKVLAEEAIGSLKVPWKDLVMLNKERNIFNNTYVIPIGEVFEKIPTSIPKGFKWISLTESLPKGAQVLNNWQCAIGDKFPLWRDHLPELSMKVIREGRLGQFKLVKDTTIAPKRGKTVDIPINEKFTLPAGQKFYQFDLDKGEGRKKIEYIAYLKSPAFPLKNDTECELEMKYTYGADDSYELIFKPVSKKNAEFTLVKAQWMEKSSIFEEKASIAPKFPKRFEWSDFERFSGENGTTDLLDWIRRQLDNIDSYSTFLIEEPEEVNGTTRVYVDISDCNWRVDRNGDYFAFLRLHEYGEVFLHQREYEVFDLDAQDVSFNLRESDRGGYYAKNVSLGFSLPKDTVKRLRKAIRFPMLTVWDQGHSLSESSVPNSFRTRMKNSIDNIVKLLEYEENNEADYLANEVKFFKEELFFVLCCIHKDAPKTVVSKLLRISEDSKERKKYIRHLAFAFGDAKLQWQKELIENILQDINSDTLTILAIALWRDSELINSISEEKLIAITEKLKKSLSEARLSEDSGHYDILALTYELELLLALLRTRDSKDAAIKDMLSPNFSLAKEFVDILEKITEGIFNIKRIDGFRVHDTASILKSHVRLQINKPASYYSTPDLLYALNMYLTGDSGADKIEITSVSDEE